MSDAYMYESLESGLSSVRKIKATDKCFLGEVAAVPKVKWELMRESEGVKVFKRNTEVFDIIMFKSESTVKCSPAQAFDFLNPAKHYRRQWDPLMEKLEEVKHYAEGVLIVTHAEKKDPDVMSVGETADYYYIIATEPFAVHRNNGYMGYSHLTQFLNAYVINKDREENGRTKVEMIRCESPEFDYGFNAEGLKPRLMIQTFLALKGGLKDITYSG